MVSITRERTLLKEVGLANYRLREDWGARRSYTNSRTVVEPATRVFVHITVTNPGNYSSFDAHARAIESIGISRFPNTGISYNRLIQAGTLLVYEGQPIGRRGAHTVNNYRISTCTRSGTRCPGRHGPVTAPSWNLNYNSRAYVYCSNVQYDFDDNSLDTMARAIAADKMAGFVAKSARIHGHRCVSAKSCPGENVFDRLKELEGLVNAYMQGGIPMALDDDDVRRIWRRDGLIDAPPRSPSADTNQFWAAQSYLKNLADRVVYPRSGDNLVQVIKSEVSEALLPAFESIKDEIDALPEPADLTPIQSQLDTIQSQLGRLQTTVDALVAANFLTWEEMGDTAWKDLGSWESLTRNQIEVTVPDIEPTAIKASAKAGAQEALSSANLEVSW